MCCVYHTDLVFYISTSPNHVSRPIVSLYDSTPTADTTCTICSFVLFVLSLFDKPPLLIKSCTLTNDLACFANSFDLTSIVVVVDDVDVVFEEKMLCNNLINAIESNNKSLPCKLLGSKHITCTLSLLLAIWTKSCILSQTLDPWKMIGCFVDV